MNNNEQKTTKLELTQNEIIILINIINASNISGEAMDFVYPLKMKIKSILENKPKAEEEKEKEKEKEVKEEKK